jgi:predicted DCC family thiol-disulfide oxidoreductase YuxK
MGSPIAGGTAKGLWHFLAMTRDQDLAARLGLSAELNDAAGIILFDGRCRFCRWVVRSLLAADPALRVCSVHTPRGRALVETFGRVPEDTFGFLTPEAARFDVEAYVAIRARRRRTRWLARLIAWTPAVIAGGIYRWVANHRSMLSALVPTRWVTTIDAGRFIAGGAEE